MLLEMRWKLLGRWAKFLVVMLSNTFMGVARGESWRDSTARPWNLEAEFPLGGKGHPSRAIN
jgi:hypothetical protein